MSKKSSQIPEPKRIPCTNLMGLTELPQCKGIIPTPIKGQKISRRHANCPIHGNTGTETNWIPSDGLNKNMREFCCELGHAFYC